MSGREPVLVPFGPAPAERVQLVQPGARRTYPPDVRARLERDAATVVARYPRPRSAIIPLLHLLQAEDGYLTPAAIDFVSHTLDLTGAEVAAVATFYSMYRREPTGDYLVGVCTNTLCAVMGGDAIHAALTEHLADDPGAVTLEHIECNAACDYAPVIMVNWEFFDNQTPESARTLVDDLRSGRPVTPTRGTTLCTFRETSRILAGFPDPRPGADDAATAGEATLAGLRVARESGLSAPDPARPGPSTPPEPPDVATDSTPDEPAPAPSADVPGKGLR
ncbi:NADH-quinone oxidoreductase subunit NuoE [Rhodococcoides corynebacterioides]|uniref:NADH-quinone oxidoreductase subunit NuoE n=1 Tax=Rhodococcoides corynebacterioides TaxID=53972 RepID=A0ABS7P6I9_9NOCA|nr:NADH-quinone oxidoreductase subunit NuoE [Rhodococcus corynebacterioides]MBY6368043.1 NADH-quinone oxidoreductase subunit NuoE [Rhodococcus corynebacterioides]MBY6407504.1 NADH-quinone oxidoreductase subunit NuoE [Rhodococcus corynebacterioides]